MKFHSIIKLVESKPVAAPLHRDIALVFEVHVQVILFFLNELIDLRKSGTKKLDIILIGVKDSKCKCYLYIGIGQNIEAFNDVLCG
ncbi:Hypothetical predicted protein [Olea europaea subsp. europaea]|uniref:Uncharacterized protein n=1 Tax=Olea europaea subsp. europaea TaxID=158383 RepID=A0A8S0QGQ1_OLEEU|nr:Hypothetical predicted protein [Olea europaea subsp. europaea]